MNPKQRLLATLEAMPDEAFGWVVQTLARQPIFPDGLGGFREESRRAIAAFNTALAAAAAGE